MRQSIIRAIGLLFLVGGFFGVAFLATGCSGESLPSGFSIGTPIRDVVFQGQTYRPTGEILGLERFSPEGLTYAGTGVALGELPSGTAESAGDAGYELYTIAGVDSHQAIAVKFAAADRSGKGRQPYWVWMRYERERSARLDSLPHVSLVGSGSKRIHHGPYRCHSDNETRASEPTVGCHWRPFGVALMSSLHRRAAGLCPVVPPDMLDSQPLLGGKARRACRPHLLPRGLLDQV